MSRTCGQSVTTDERRTFTKVLGADKDKVHHDQTPGNNNKDAIFDYRNSFHESEKTRNCHISVTSVMIITFIMFSLKQSTFIYLSAVIFFICAISFVTFNLCVNDIRMLRRNVCGIK